MLCCPSLLSSAASLQAGAVGGGERVVVVSGCTKVTAENSVCVCVLVLSITRLPS